MSNILIIAEHQDGRFKKYALELASKAFELSKELGGHVVALAMGDVLPENHEELGRYGVKKVLSAVSPELKFYSAERYSEIVFEQVKNENASIVLGSATPMGRDLLPKVAAKLKAGSAQDCIAADIENGRLKVRRPVFAGKALIDLVFEGAPQVATLRTNIFPLVERGVTSDAVNVKYVLKPSKAVVKEMKASEKGELDISEADIIVAGGRAIGNADNFKTLYELAHTFRGAAVGASRAAVDAGYISHDHQVGQTGKTINPNLYIACGVSGSIQHLAGMRTSKVIIAINTDPDAPIFSKADLGIVGDLFKVVPAVTGRLKKLSQQ